MRGSCTAHDHRCVATTSRLLRIHAGPTKQVVLPLPDLFHPAVPQVLEPLEHAISDRLIPATTGQAPPGTAVRCLLSMPCQRGGLGIANLCSMAKQYISSRRITASLVSRLLEQESSLGDSLTQLRTVKATVRAEMWSTAKSMSDALRSDHRELTPVLDLVSERGASSWLTCCPLSHHSFTLTKGEFRDGLCLRYGWTPPRLPSLCVCSKPLNVSHALSCPFGGFPTLRHNEVRDITARPLRQVAHNMTAKPPPPARHRRGFPPSHSHHGGAGSAGRCG